MSPTVQFNSIIVIEELCHGQQNASDIIRSSDYDPWTVYRMNLKTGQRHPKEGSQH